jgi:general secretion pathway protein A
MYRKYFGLKRPPFSIAPDPRYLFMSGQHREALAHLLYGVRSDGGFVLLTGEVGTGKTTVCRRLLETLTKNVVVAFIIHPTLSVAELLATVCDEFGIGYPRKATIKILVDSINAFLLDLNARRKKAILIIEEAQNLSHDVLEQIRLLTNLETNERKLLQIILIGQPELRDKLARPEFKQLTQRIVARYHLEALSKAEVTNYVHHRLTVAMGKRLHSPANPPSGQTTPASEQPPPEPSQHSDSIPAPAAAKGIGESGNSCDPTKLFSQDALNSLYTYSDGVPRLINLICDRALLGAFVQGKESVDGDTLTKAACEVLGRRLPPTNPRWKIALTAAILICACLGLLYYLSSRSENVGVSKNENTGEISSILKPLPQTPEVKKSVTETNGPDVTKPSKGGRKNSE